MTARDTRTITTPGARLGRVAITPSSVESSTMKWANVLLLLLAVSFAVPSAAQTPTGRITGTVTDSASGQPIQSATVLVVGTQIGAVTNTEGRYTINSVPEGTQQLRVQRLGYAARTTTVVVVAGQTITANFTTPAQVARLNTVVSVGYGTQRARDVTGSVSTVTTEALEHTPIVSVDQVLQGTSPGVNVTTASNEPGGALSVRIRGTSSITGNPEPLYVIDGFPVESDAEGTSPGNGGRSRTTPTNPLVAINPSDIESISILKDASATAIYGSRGANGVVIITTRQGRGAKPTFTVDYSTGVSTVAKKYDLLTAAEYMDYANIFGQGSSTPFTPFPTTPDASGTSVYQRVLDSGIDTDWQDQIFRTGGVKNLQLSMRGASTTANVTRYAISGGVFDQDGIVLGSGLKRLSGRVNVNQSIGSRFEVGGSLTGSQVRSKSTPTSGQQNAGAGAVSAALQYVPILPVYRADGTYTYINSDLNAYNTLLDAPPTPNPVSLAREVTDSLSDNRLLTNLYAQAQLLDNLTFRTTYGTDYANRGHNTYYNRNTVSGALAGGQAYVGSTTSNTWLNENTLTYQRAFGEVHDLTVLGGFTQQRTDFNGLNLSASNFPSDVTLYNTLQAGATQGVPSSRRNSRTLESWLGRVNYSLLDRYLFTVNYRADGSSAFAESHKWAGFPSAAFAWRLSSEPFMKRFAAIDELKLRASYGVVGNPGIRPYQSLTRLTSQGYSFGGQYTSGYAVSAVGNPDLRWETTKGSDFGIDVSLLDRFAITADYYAKKTTDLLLQVSLPFETGYQTALANRGSVENKGFEFGLDAQIIKPTASGFSWHANLNFAKNRNKVLDLGTNPDGSPIPYIEADLLTTDYNLPGTRIVVGQPIGVFYGFQSLGVLQDAAQAAAVTYKPFSGSAFRPGQTLIANVDASNDQIDLNDRTIIGDPTPDFTGGLTNDLRFGSVQFTALLQGSHGGKILNVNRIRTESSPRANISRDRYLNAWSPTNPTGTEPQIGENPNQVGPNNFTSNLLEDGSYLRLRSATLSFALPERLTTRTNMSNARLYLTGTNLITWTHYSGFDPDVSGQSVGTTNRGIDIGAYPLARGVTVGLNLNF
jgi:TonB-dependent starch-binding outer membrane protein SusC